MPTHRTLASDQLVSHTLKYAGEKLVVNNFAADRLINESLANHGVWEPWQLTLMRRIVAQDFTCVDVGADIGINAMFMARRCPKGRVIAFEPFDAIYEVLQKNIRANGLSNITAVNKGISDAAGTLNMVTDVSLVGGAHISAPGGHGADHVEGTFRFDRLDQQMSEAGVKNIDFMKIDVEGHELPVLHGAGRLLENPNLQLIIEFNPGQLRRAIGGDNAFPDQQLLLRLQRHFGHVFYMNRDNTLSEIRDYHALRRKLLGGYFVDDLYCTNIIPPQAMDLVSSQPTVDPSLRVTRLPVGGATITAINRDLDGWALGNKYHPSTMSLTIEGKPWQTIRCCFDPIHRKHLHLSGYASWPVWVLVGGVGRTFDLLDAPAEFTVQIGQSPVDITIQSEHQTPAAVYLGNPTDTRHVGFRVDFSEL